MEGKPWIGFAVKKSAGKKTIYVQDVAEGGPADKAGLQDGDELLSFGGVRTGNMNAFRSAYEKHAIPGNTIMVEFARDHNGVDNAIQRTVPLQIGRKGREIITDVPPMNTVRDLELILQDPVKLDKATRACFAATDDDFSGLVTRDEFSTSMRSWLPPDLVRTTTEAELQQLFNSVDIDRSGYLSKSEFPPIVKLLFQTLISKNQPLQSRSIPTPAAGSKPWIGFAVKKAPGGKKTIWVQDVADGGPADQAGLRDEDELISFGGVRVQTMADFRRAYEQHAIVGRTVNVEFARDMNGVDNAYRSVVPLLVGTRTKEIFTDMPPMNTTRDLEIILQDRKKLDKVTRHCFQAADEDLSGLVTRSEFLQAMRSWLTPSLSRLTTDSDLMSIFDHVDVDRSGFLARSEFPPIVTILFRAIIEKDQPVAAPVPVPPPAPLPRAPSPPAVREITREVTREVIVEKPVPVISQELFFPAVTLDQNPAIGGQLATGEMIAFLKANTITDGSGRKVLFNVFEESRGLGESVVYTLVTDTNAQLYSFHKGGTMVEVLDVYGERILTCKQTASGWMLLDNKDTTGDERQVALYYTSANMLKWVPTGPENDTAIWFAIGVILNRMMKAQAPRPHVRPAPSEPYSPTTMSPTTMSPTHSSPTHFVAPRVVVPTWRQYSPTSVPIVSAAPQRRAYYNPTMRSQSIPNTTIYY